MPLISTQAGRIGGILSRERMYKLEYQVGTSRQRLSRQNAGSTLAWNRCLVVSKPASSEIAWAKAPHLPRACFRLAQPLDLANLVDAACMIGGYPRFERALSQFQIRKAGRSRLPVSWACFVCSTLRGT